MTAADEILTVAEMTAADRMAVESGVASLALMEAAGGAVAELVQSRWPRQAVAVLCGPGNNGGDGFVCARHLRHSGWPVRLALFGREDSRAGDARENAARWRAAGGDILAADAPQLLDGRPLVVDALFGAGLNRAVNGLAAAAVKRINGEHLTSIAIDVPSGVAGDSGRVLGGDDGAPQCAATVTFFRRKPAHLLYPARALCGEVAVADIGIPDSVLTRIRPSTAHNTPHLWTLPQPTWRDHKYRRGSALIFGSAEMTGAARLAARAARRIGAGLATFAVPPAAADVYAISEPGALLQKISSADDFDRCLQEPRRNGVLIGPGYGVGLDTVTRVLRILATDKAVVLDADALTCFADNPAQLFAAIHGRTAPVVMTPHQGEFDRLFPGIGAEFGKLAAARAAAVASDAIVVLKGADTVVAAPDGRAAIADNAPPWLGTGGAGDVLAGFVLGLVVQGMGGFEAAAAAVWIHGAAATRAGRGLIAEDLPEALPKVLESLAMQVVGHP